MLGSSERDASGTTDVTLRIYAGDRLSKHCRAVMLRAPSLGASKSRLVADPASAVTAPDREDDTRAGGIAGVSPSSPPSTELRRSLLHRAFTGRLDRRKADPMNEADTRANLIDPALVAAGWGTGDAVIRREVYLAQERADVKAARLQGLGSAQTLQRLRRLRAGVPRPPARGRRGQGRHPRPHRGPRAGDPLREEAEGPLRLLHQRPRHLPLGPPVRRGGPGRPVPHARRAVGRHLRRAEPLARRLRARSPSRAAAAATSSATTSGTPSTPCSRASPPAATACC